MLEAIIFIKEKKNLALIAVTCKNLCYHKETNKVLELLFNDADTYMFHLVRQGLNV